jgi:hypothetical protein
LRCLSFFFWLLCCLSIADRNKLALVLTRHQAT